VVSDRFSAYGWLPTAQRQISWAPLRRDLTVFAQRHGAIGEIGRELLEQQKQLFHHWSQSRGGESDREQLHPYGGSIRRLFEATLQRVSDLGFLAGEKTPWASTVHACRRILTVASALWRFLAVPGVEATNSGVERALRQVEIYRKLSYSVQSTNGGRCLTLLLTVTTSLKQQGRDVLGFLVAARQAHHHGEPMPCLLPQGA